MSVGYIEPNPRANRSGWPRDLADEGPASDVTKSYDINIFNWDFEPNKISTGLSVTIRPKLIYLSADVRDLLFRAAEKSGATDGEVYWVHLGLAAKAIAIKSSCEKGEGFKASGAKSGSQISCAGFVKELNKLGIKGTTKLTGEWDDKNKMLVVKLPANAERKK